MSLKIKETKEIEKNSEFIEILRDEVNVNEVRFNGNTDGFASSKLGLSRPGEGAEDIEIYLDTNLTDELIKDGALRELTRALQEARKKAGLAVGQKVALTYKTDDELMASVIKEKLEEIKETANFSSIDLASEDLPVEILNGKIKVKPGIPKPVWAGYRAVQKQIPRRVYVYFTI